MGKFFKQAVSFQKTIGPSIIKRLESIQLLEHPGQRAQKTQQTLRQLTNMEKRQVRLNAANKFISGENVMSLVGGRLNTLLTKVLPLRNANPYNKGHFSNRVRIQHWPDASTNIKKLKASNRSNNMYGKREVTLLTKLEQERPHEYTNKLKKQVMSQLD